MFWQKIRTQLSSLVFPNSFVLPIWNLQKITILFGTVRPTLAESLKLPWHGFYKTATIEEKREVKKTSKDGRHLLY